MAGILAALHQSTNRHHSNAAVALGATAIVQSTEPNRSPQGVGNVDADVTLPSKQRSWKTGSELADYIHERRVTHEDFLYYVRSLISVLWLRNPVKTSAFSLAGELEKIAEKDDSEVIALRVRQGLSSIDLGVFDDLVEATADCVAELLNEFLNDNAYVELYPGLKSISVEPDFNVSFLKNDVARQLRQLQDVYNDICQKYNLLNEGFARYDKIMMGGSFWKNVILGGALGFLTGGIGVVAAVAWGGWSHMSDKDFVQNYSGAIQDFLSSCDSFTDRGQELLSQKVMSIQDLWSRAFAREEAYLLALNAEGMNLDDVERQICEKAKQEIQDAPNVLEMTQHFALALQFLKQDAPISEKRIGKIVESLRKCGMLLCADGTIDEAATQALVPTEASGDDTMDRFQQIVGACAHFDRFYILDAIPNDKLINALHDYGNGLNEEHVLCLYDSTIFGGGGDGFIVAPGGICSKQLGCDPCAWTWGDMKSISASDAKGCVVTINGVNVNVPYGGAGEFVNMFRRLKDLFVGSLGLDSDDSDSEESDDAATVMCPNCGEFVVANDGNRTYQCEECGEDFEVGVFDGAFTPQYDNDSSGWAVAEWLVKSFDVPSDSEEIRSQLEDSHEEGDVADPDVFLETMRDLGLEPWEPADADDKKTIFDDDNAFADDVFSEGGQIAVCFRFAKNGRGRHWVGLELHDGEVRVMDPLQADGYWSLEDWRDGIDVGRIVAVYGFTV